MIETEVERERLGTCLGNGASNAAGGVLEERERDRGFLGL